MRKKDKSKSGELEGCDQAIRLFGEEHVRDRIAGWRRMDPEIADIFTNLTYKGLYARTVLEPKVRQLCTISALTIVNALPSLRSHIIAAFRVGATEAEIKEAIVQMAAYCGMPYVGQAIKTFEAVKEQFKGQDMTKVEVG